MLKIKNDIDLKRLEDYGFTYYENKNYKVYQKGELFDQYMTIPIKTREIEIFTSDDRGIDDDTLYDLIIDGLVEKIKKD